MEQYIKKSDIVAEIERRIKEISKECEESKTIQFTLIGKINALENLLPFLNTLEVKEVDLDKERRKYLTEHFNVYEDGILQSKRSGMPLDTFDIIQVAKHFFELGIKVKK